MEVCLRRQLRQTHDVVRHNVKLAVPGEHDLLDLRVRVRVHPLRRRDLQRHVQKLLHGLVALVHRVVYDLAVHLSGARDKPVRVRRVREVVGGIDPQRLSAEIGVRERIRLCFRHGLPGRFFVFRVRNVRLRVVRGASAGYKHPGGEEPGKQKGKRSVLHSVLHSGANFADSVSAALFLHTFIISGVHNFVKRKSAYFL